ncbi:MAG: peptide-methionine (S)-S-oxide reductase MsrA [Candidatus Eremiobacteraeota bacterium]|uniref:peptide-methionine (S)-S-oxide reductase n=1 Tax=mine drainage metagenome TaxID=410659 RepID=E6PE44_9ZZZZ|nr:peptide-methionine (S)-S-oxide reductase MsrA [Candidatus Eremiobacteraeota bacterium]
MHAFERTRNVAVALLLLLASLGASPQRGTPPPAPTERIVLAGGCFWGMQAVFQRLVGVSRTVVGYAGGSARTAHYEIVSTGQTRQAESVEIWFDPHVISLRQLFAVYFTVAHNPTELNYQGPDVGHQYRSEIFYTTAHQRAVAEATIAALTKAHRFDAPIVTLVAPLRAFYRAEAYHQNFERKHPNDPYIVEVDLPKLRALRRAFPNLVAHAHR